MQLTDSDLDPFCAWLCEHEHDVVGRPGMTHHNPLAQWLSERSGHTYGVDGRVYGRASCAFHCWRLLPRWAEVFVAWSESVTFRPITGSEALAILAGVEMALQRLDSPWQQRSQTTGILLWLNIYRRAQTSHPRFSVLSRKRDDR
jgi:hypothetical protein